MKTSEYMKGVLRTENMDLTRVHGRLTQEKIRLLHSALGLVTEGGELVDHLKRYVFYGARFDKFNVLEELGDILWYVCTCLHVIGEDLESCMKVNQEKLKKRYPRTFSEEKAIRRDLKAERVMLEKK